MYVCGRMFALFVRTPYRKTAEDISTELLVVATILGDRYVCDSAFILNIFIHLEW